jgi:hypothetical protein
MIIRLYISNFHEVFFWGVHAAAEIDLIFQKKGRLYGIEVKYAQAPNITQSMRSAIAELSLEHLWIIYPGKESYPLDRNVTVISLQDIQMITKV